MLLNSWLFQIRQVRLIVCRWIQGVVLWSLKSVEIECIAAKQTIAPIALFMVNFSYWHGKQNCPVTRSISFVKCGRNGVRSSPSSVLRALPPNGRSLGGKTRSLFSRCNTSRIPCKQCSQQGEAPRNLITDNTEKLTVKSFFLAHENHSSRKLASRDIRSYFIIEIRRCILWIFGKL